MKEIELNNMPNAWIAGTQYKHSYSSGDYCIAKFSNQYVLTHNGSIVEYDTEELETLYKRIATDKLRRNSQ